MVVICSPDLQQTNLCGAGISQLYEIKVKVKSSNQGHHVPYTVQQNALSGLVWGKNCSKTSFMWANSTKMHGQITYHLGYKDIM